MIINMQGLPLNIEPIEYLKHFNPESLFNCYFVNKYFQKALETRDVLKTLNIIHEKCSRPYTSYTFADFVYMCDHNYLTPRTKKYINSKDMYHLIAEKGDLLQIYEWLNAGNLINYGHFPMGNDR
jgi:hypothetical protein